MSGWTSVRFLAKYLIDSIKLFPIKKNSVIKMGGKIIKFREIMSHDQQLPADFQ
jgi:hypothetical protein